LLLKLLSGNKKFTLWIFFLKKFVSFIKLTSLT